MIGEIIGQEISVNVPKNMKAQVIPQGNSYQATREGYNLFDYINKVENNGVLTYTIDKDTGYITVNGTPTWDYATCVSSFNIDDILEDGETYSVWQEVYSNKVNGGMYIQLQIKSKDGKASQWINSSTGKLNFTVDKTKYSYNIMIQCGTISEAGTFNNYKNRYMIYKGTDDKTFELYGVSPSLDYPSEVEAVGDNINLYPYSDVEFKSDATQEQWCYLDGQLGAYGNTVTDKTDYKITLEKGKYYFKLETADSNIITGGLVANGESSEKQLTVFDNAFEITETTVCTLRLKVANPSLGINIKSIKLEKGTAATPYSPYGQGNIEIIHNNKNELILNDNNSQSDGLNFSIKDGVITISGTATSTYQGLYIPVKRTFNEDYVLSTNAVGSKTGLHIKAAYKLENGNLQYPDIFTRFVFPTNSYLEQLYVIVDSGSTIDATIKLQLEKGTEATEFVENKGNTYTIPVQKPFYKIGDYSDGFIKQNNKWYEQHYIKELVLTGNENWSKSQSSPYPTYIIHILNNVIEGKNGLSNYFKIYNSVWLLDLIGIEFYDIYSNDFKFRINLGSNTEITTVEAWKAKVQELYNAGTPIKVYYVLATPELIECTEEQTQILEQLNNLYLYEGINYLYSTDDPSPIFQFSYDKIVNDFKFYLSENGRLIFPKENISFLCSISESTIPVMPEALETSAIIAGRDGDVPLSTTYGPMSFELVLYTEDNLTPEEKLKQEIFLNRFCNSIKNNTETFALELAQKFYKIKYNGLLNKENYPKFLKFTLPFKSSKSFAYDVKKNTAYGNNTFESNTIEPTGFECVIKGPAIKPIISLNDYSIEYNNTILDDESLIIDTNNSTAVLVNSEGTRVNAMRYYNHQFPKILNGENELKVLSGIDNPENVSISWYDLTL